MTELKQAVANLIKPTDPLKRLRRKFGTNFPDIFSKKAPSGKEWRAWIDSSAKEQDSVLQDKKLHYARHRLFRSGFQRIALRDGRKWKEPRADENDIYITDNIIGPGLDFRLGIMTEQRPGFRYEPLGSGTTGRETAEAQQAVAEYYFKVLRAWLTFNDAARQAQTDGAAFIHIFVDKFAGPEWEDVDLIPPDDPRYGVLSVLGYETDEDDNIKLPYVEEGLVGKPDDLPRTMYDGDLSHRLVYANQVLFDPEARSVNGPDDRARWAVIKRLRDVKSARLETGNSEIEPETTSDADWMTMMEQYDIPTVQRGLPPFPMTHLQTRNAVPEYLLFLAPDNEDLPEGKLLRLVGKELVEENDELPGGVIPLARFTDGSTDPAILPRPVMSDYIPDQIAINMLESMMAQTIRLMPGRILVRKNSLIEETYSAIVGSKMEFEGERPELMQPGQVGRDLWQYWAAKKKALEDKMGYTDFARGQVSGGSISGMQDVSGRALLGAQEMFERTFGPPIRAHAEGATEWAQIIVKYAQWLFDEPRLIPIVGGRGDLAKLIDSEKLGSRPVVYCDPETLMPEPRALRNQRLYDLLTKGLISLDEYQRRAVHADIRDVHMGEVDQWQRAQTVNMVLEEQYEELMQGAAMDPLTLFSPDNGLEVLWQDNASIHKRALDELIADQRKPWEVRKLASDRWGIYDQLERAKTLGPTQWPIPAEVLGIPPDIVAMSAPQQPQLAPSAGAPAPGATETGGLASPLSVGGTPPAASQMEAAPLGTQGAAERAAVADQTRS